MTEDEAKLRFLREELDRVIDEKGKEIVFLLKENAKLQTVNERLLDQLKRQEWRIDALLSEKVAGAKTYD